MRRNKNKNCEYCQTRNELIQCQCGKYFCTGKITNTQNKDCQLFYHMKHNQHYSVFINNQQLKCSSCEETNIFNLKTHRNNREVKCHDCIDELPREQQEEYSESIYSEGDCKLQTYGINQSQQSVDMKEVEEIEGKEETVNLTVKVQEQYVYVNEYFQVYNQLNIAEQQKTPEIVERSFRTKGKTKRISFFKKDGKINFVMHLDEPIRGLLNNNTVYITAGGNAGIITKKNIDYFEDDLRNTFESCKCVMKGTVVNCETKRIIVEIDHNHFEDLFETYDLHRRPNEHQIRRKWKPNIGIIR